MNNETMPATDDGLWGIVLLVAWALLLLAVEWIDEHTGVSK